MFSARPYQEISGFDAVFANLSVLRLDQLDELGSGNKAFKLKYNLREAGAQGLGTLASFGGAFSNHIHALALLGRKQGFATLGMIRGERSDPLNETLRDAVDAGMQLHYLSRSDYHRRYDPLFLAELQARYSDCYWIPEGGSNLQGVRGCMDIGDHIDSASELIVLPCATAATVAGVAAACPDRRVLGISVLKNARDLEERVAKYHWELLQAGHIDSLPDNWTIEHGYHCGGYAKLHPQLADFVVEFSKTTGIPVEPIYSGKMFYAIYQLLSGGAIDKATRITAIHTGGMQGLRGIQSRLNSRLSPAVV